MLRSDTDLSPFFTRDLGLTTVPNIEYLNDWRRRELKVTVMSRRNAVLYCGQKNPDKSVMISISDPRMVYDSEPFASPANGIIDILHLSFSDADSEGLDVYGNCVDESDLMTDEDARRVAEFVEAHKDAFILVHCDAGISRSAGVAAAILKHYTGDDSRVFKSGRHYPNMWCYRKTLNALHSYTPVPGYKGV